MPLEDPCDELRGILANQARFRPPREHHAGGSFADLAKRARQAHRQTGSLAALWLERVPPAVARHTSLHGLTRGVLTVAVDDSAALYELDRLLRGGLDHQLIAAHTGPAFRRIKLRLIAGTGESDV